jgi:hypothetical protein
VLGVLGAGVGLISAGWLCWMGSGCKRDGLVSAACGQVQEGKKKAASSRPAGVAGLLCFLLVCMSIRDAHPCPVSIKIQPAYA